MAAPILPALPSETSAGEKTEGEKTEGDHYPLPLTKRAVAWVCLEDSAAAPGAACPSSQNSVLTHLGTEHGLYNARDP